MEFKKEKIYTPLVATPTHNVSQAIKYGDLVFVSGMVGEDENEVLREGLEAQCEQAFLNRGCWFQFGKGAVLPDFYWQTRRPCNCQ